MEQPETERNSERATIILHSGDMDKMYSALIVANGALAMGMEATIFFTFWGLQRGRWTKARSPRCTSWALANGW
jgi:peroxiredoxin family protein